MKTIDETRLDRLNRLIERFGSIAELNERLGRPRNEATLYQLKNRSPDTTTGTPKNIGDGIAREIEVKLGLERGWMDNPIDIPDYDESTRRGANLLQAMEPEERYKAIRILDTLAKPPLDGDPPPDAKRRAA